MKAHPKDPAPSAYSDELISTSYAVQKDKHRRSSSTSSRTESAVSSLAQNTSDVADLQNLDALNFESDFESNTEIQDWKISRGKIKGQEQKHKLGEIGGN